MFVGVWESWFSKYLSFPLYSFQPHSVLSRQSQFFHKFLFYLFSILIILILFNFYGSLKFMMMTSYCIVDSRFFLHSSHERAIPYPPFLCLLLHILMVYHFIFSSETPNHCYLFFCLGNFSKAKLYSLYFQKYKNLFVNKDSFF